MDCGSCSPQQKEKIIYNSSSGNALHGYHTLQIFMYKICLCRAILLNVVYNMHTKCWPGVESQINDTHCKLKNQSPPITFCQIQSHVGGLSTTSHIRTPSASRTIYATSPRVAPCLKCRRPVADQGHTPANCGTHPGQWCSAEYTATLAESAPSHTAGRHPPVGRHKRAPPGRRPGARTANTSSHPLSWTMCAWRTPWGTKLAERARRAWRSPLSTPSSRSRTPKSPRRRRWTRIDLPGTRSAAAACWIPPAREETHPLRIPAPSRFASATGTPWRRGPVVAALAAVATSLSWYRTPWMCDSLLGLGSGLCQNQGFRVSRIPCAGGFGNERTSTPFLRNPHCQIMEG